MVRDDIIDHDSFLREFGITERHLAALSDDSDVISFPFDCAQCFVVADSPIHGAGVFARRSVAVGEIYAPARIHGCRTPGGRFVNHAKQPNSRFVSKGGDLHLQAIKPIEPGDELTLDYRQALTENMRSRAVVEMPAHTVIASGDPAESLERAMSQPAIDARAHAFALEDEIGRRVSDGAMEELPGPVRHYFADGVYVRALFLRKGSFAVGKVHKHDHIAIMLCGDMTIVDATGDKRMKGPGLPFLSRAGVKRAVIVHEDTWFLNIHGKRDHQISDPGSIEAYYVCDTESEFRDYVATELNPVASLEGAS